MFNRNGRLYKPLYALILCLLVAVSIPASANQPVLAFSDLISGPDTGLGDGKGSGVIVTVWGTGLGSPGSGSRLLFQDSSGTQHAPHVYYWKNADGRKPSGPANLHESHGMQEIAFSIPDSSTGRGEILVESESARSNSLPFTVRSGQIFHIRSNGSDSNSGDFESPLRTVGRALETAPSGSTIYIHDVDTGSFANPGPRAIYWRNADATSSLNNQYAIVSYPGFQPKAIAQRSVENYRVEGMVVSKLDLYSSNYLSVDSRGQPTGGRIDSGESYGIQSSKNGRAVANRIGEIPGGCSSITSGAIIGNATFGDRVSNFKALGNEIYEYGCNGSSKLHHTTYLSVRSGPKDTQVEPWEWGFNYLHDNKAKFGIHQFDQNEGCGDLTGPLRIYNNVIVNQGGAGISIGSQCGWSMDSYIENNVLINVGLAAAWDGVDPNTSDGPEGGGISIRDSGLTGTMYIRNNLVFKHTMDGHDNRLGCLSFQGSNDSVSVVWENNICVSELGLPFVGAGYSAESKLDNVRGSHNIWHYAGSGSAPQVPTWDQNPIVKDPSIEVSGSRIFFGDQTPVVDSGTSTGLDRDLYWVLRDSSPDIGPIEVSSGNGVFPPSPPSGVKLE